MKDIIEVLEKVQKAATNLVPKLKKYSYPDRLKMIGITYLKERRVRGDIEVYKLLTDRKGADRFRTVFHASVRDRNSGNYEF